MDESLAQTSIDISNRPYLVFNAEFKDKKSWKYDDTNGQRIF